MNISVKKELQEQIQEAKVHCDVPEDRKEAHALGDEDLTGHADIHLSLSLTFPEKPLVALIQPDNRALRDLCMMASPL